MLQNGFKVEVIKTNVVEVDDSVHSLPPYISRYAEYNVSEFFCPDEWSKDGVFIPVKEGDALWFDLRNNDDCAVLASVQKVNPVTGEPSNLEGGLSKDPTQNYMVLPQQQWIDGYAKNGKVYQFRITKAGEGLAVNEFVLPKNMQDSHAVGFAFYGLKNPKPKIEHRDHYHEMITINSLNPINSSNPIWLVDKRNRPDYYFDSTLPLRSASKGGISISSVGPVYSSNSMEVEVKTSGGIKIPENTAIMEESVSNYETAMNLFCDQISENPITEDRLEENISFDKASMGAGGRIIQKIVTDNNSVDYYKDKPSALLIIYFCLPEQFESIMKKGRRNDSNQKDRYVFSGEIAGVQVPLIV